jgi:hypothetical protein
MAAAAGACRLFGTPARDAGCGGISEANARLGCRGYARVATFRDPAGSALLARRFNVWEGYEHKNPPPKPPKRGGTPWCAAEEAALPERLSTHLDVADQRIPESLRNVRLRCNDASIHLQSCRMKQDRQYRFHLDRRKAIPETLPTSRTER